MQRYRQRFSTHEMDQETMDRLMRLPDPCARRQAILTSFGCYSLSTVMLKIWNASDEEKRAIEARIVEVLNDPALDVLPGAGVESAAGD